MPYAVPGSDDSDHSGFQEIKLPVDFVTVNAGQNIDNLDGSVLMTCDLGSGWHGQFDRFELVTAEIGPIDEQLPFVPETVENLIHHSIGCVRVRLPGVGSGF